MTSVSWDIQDNWEKFNNLNMLLDISRIQNRQMLMLPLIHLLGSINLKFCSFVIIKNYKRVQFYAKRLKEISAGCIFKLSSSIFSSRGFFRIGLLFISGKTRFLAEVAFFFKFDQNPFFPKWLFLSLRQIFATFLNNVSQLFEELASFGIVLRFVCGLQGERVRAQAQMP